MRFDDVPLLHVKMNPDAVGVTTDPVDVRPLTPSWFVYDNVNDPTPLPEPCATMNARKPLPSV